jgi:hypothetical protein
MMDRIMPYSALSAKREREREREREGALWAYKKGANERDTD